MKRLGYRQFVAQGGDWGGNITNVMGEPELLGYSHEVAAKGGHFAAWEQPQLFAQEVRAGFRSLRTASS